MACSVGVIIPAFNAEDYIEKTLDSVAMQSRRAEQLIVINDGSTDRTSEIVEAWSLRKGVPVDLINQENRGLPAARNRGIRHADTDLIALLDADDLFLPEHLSLISRPFELDPRVVLSFGDGELFNSHGVIKASLLADTSLSTVRFEEKQDGLRVCSESAYVSLLPGNYIPNGSTIFRKDAAGKIGFYDESLKYIEDRDFNLRLSRIGLFAYYPVVVHRKRTHDNNITHPRNVERNMRFQFRVLRKMVRIANSLNLSGDEYVKTVKALHRHVWEMLYVSSRKGLGSYLSTMSHLLESGFYPSMLNMKHCLRAVTFSSPWVEQWYPRGGSSGETNHSGG